LPSEAGSSPLPGSDRDAVRIGVLAQQGDFASHLEHLASVGAVGSEVREPADLNDLDGLILPGGESTTISKGLERDDLSDRVIEFGREGRPILGTCAGMILLARDHLGLLDISVKRNAFGRQRASFEEELEIPGIAPGDPFPCIFIRAPWVEESGPEVEVVGELDGHPIAVRQGSTLALSFHPELSDDDRVHGAFAAKCREARDSGDR